MLSKMLTVLVGLLLSFIGSGMAQAFFEVEVTSVDSEPFPQASFDTEPFQQSSKNHPHNKRLDDPGTCCYTPLIHYNCSGRNLYTVQWSEQQRDTYTSGCVPWGNAGYVAKKEDCQCRDGTTLIPVYRYFNVQTSDVFTSSEGEGQELNRHGYIKVGVAFYCAAEMGQCGSKNALYKYFRSSDGQITYTVDFTEGNRYLTGQNFVRQQIICYTWGRETAPYKLHD